MARKGVFRRTWDAVKSAPRRTADAVTTAVKKTGEAVTTAAKTTGEAVTKPFRRKPKPAPKPVIPPKPAVPPHPRRPTPDFGLTVDQRVARYTQLSPQRRRDQHPKDEERQFWALYDQLGE